VESKVPDCLIAIGGNLNASSDVFHKALRELEDNRTAVLDVSRVMTTQPVGSEAGSAFLNAAATLRSVLGPMELLNTLHGIEAAFGRTRTVRWGPRTLDLDLLLYAEEAIDRPELVVPHPAMWYRRFVLAPAVEVAAKMRHPLLNCTVEDLFHALNENPLSIVLEQPRLPINPKDLDLFTHELNLTCDGIEWRTDSEIPEGDSSTFARVIWRPLSAKPALRSQPHNSADRSIDLFADSSEDALAQLRLLALSITG
jgi:2-amino-4-hydroxy-6-hydroxymethyldihydropteridine diphosphokinase